MSGPEETTARGGLVLRHADDHGPGGRALGLSDQAVPGTLAGGRFQICRPYGQTHHPAGDEDQGDRTGAGRHAAEAGRRTGSARASERSATGSGRIARAAWSRCGPKTGPPARTRQASDATGSGRLRRRGPAPQGRGAGTWERGDAGGGGGHRKRPGRRPAAPVEQGKTLPVDRPRPTYSPGPMTCLPGIAPGSHLLPPRQAWG